MEQIRETLAGLALFRKRGIPIRGDSGACYTLALRDAVAFLRERGSHERAAELEAVLKEMEEVKSGE